VLKQQPRVGEVEVSTRQTGIKYRRLYEADTVIPAVVETLDSLIKQDAIDLDTRKPAGWEQRG
jgi:hypothetical protein